MLLIDIVILLHRIIPPLIVPVTAPAKTILHMQMNPVQFLQDLHRSYLLEVPLGGILAYRTNIWPLTYLMLLALGNKLLYYLKF